MVIVKIWLLLENVIIRDNCNNKLLHLKVFIRIILILNVVAGPAFWDLAEKYLVRKTEGKAATLIKF
jgi:hypothetical protein